MMQLRDRVKLQRVTWKKGRGVGGVAWGGQDGTGQGGRS